jgi:hypothetical protein
VKKSGSLTKGIFIVIFSTVLSTLMVNLIEKRDILTTKEKLTSHFEEFKKNDQSSVSVVLKRKIGDQYILLYTTKGQNEKIGIAYYTKTDLFPFYELIRDEEAQNPILGSGYLNKEQFIVYGNVKGSGAEYFKYRNYIDFKKVNLPNGPYFLHVETYEGKQLSVPLVTLYSEEGNVVAAAPAQ